MPIKYTTLSFINKAKIIHGDQFSYDRCRYGENQRDKVWVTCRKHGDFLIGPSQHLRGKGGCSHCKRETTSRNKRMSTEEFIRRSKEIYGSRFTYEKTNYIRREMPVTINCPDHGPFEVRPTSHLYQGVGCGRCDGKEPLDPSSFFSRCVSMHGGRYDYSETIFSKVSSSITYACRIHGKVKQLAFNHLTGSGCPRCYGKLTHEEFVRRAENVHGKIYHYDDPYRRCDDLLNIRCARHGKFLQRPQNHLQGQGCPKCAKRISRKETLWLASLGNPNLQYQKMITVSGSNYFVDGYDETTNTIFEFYGDKWHGNPNVKFGSDHNPVNGIPYATLHNRTLLREEALLSAGYRLVTIWESDWDNQNDP